MKTRHFFTWQASYKIKFSIQCSLFSQNKSFCRFLKPRTCMTHFCGGSEFKMVSTGMEYLVTDAMDLFLIWFPWLWPKAPDHWCVHEHHDECYHAHMLSPPVVVEEVFCLHFSFLFVFKKIGVFLFVILHCGHVTFFWFFFRNVSSLKFSDFVLFFHTKHLFGVCMYNYFL